MYKHKDIIFISYVIQIHSLLNKTTKNDRNAYKIFEIPWN